MERKDVIEIRLKIIALTGVLISFFYGIYQYEKINDDHEHNAIGLLMNYRLLPRLSITVSPALSFEGNHTDEYNFVIHVETGYEVELHNFHIGPVIGFAYEPEDTHISAGVHIALGF